MRETSDQMRKLSQENNSLTNPQPIQLVTHEFRGAGRAHLDGLREGFALHVKSGIPSQHYESAVPLKGLANMPIRVAFGKLRKGLKKFLQMGNR